MEDWLRREIGREVGGWFNSSFFKIVVTFGWLVGWLVVSACGTLDRHQVAWGEQAHRRRPGSTDQFHTKIRDCIRDCIREVVGLL